LLWLESSICWNPEPVFCRPDMRPRAPTLRHKDAECLITEFQCATEGSLSTTATKAWKVMIGGFEDTPKFVDVRLTVSKGIGGSPKVKLEDKGYSSNDWHMVFPVSNLQAAGATLGEELVHQWKIRNMVDVLKGYEVKMIGVDDVWCKCTLANETQDGKFDVTFTKPGAEKTTYPGFGQQDGDGLYLDLRNLDGRPLKHLRKSLVMRVAKEDPLRKVTLSLVSEGDADGAGSPKSGQPAISQFVTDLFGRPTPMNLGQPDANIEFPTIQIDKFRKEAVVPGWSTTKFTRYVQHKVSAVRMNHANKLNAEWVFRIGLNEHKVRVEKKKGKLVTVFVDDVLFVEATPEDIALAEGQTPAEAKQATGMKFTCDFRGKHKFAFSFWKVNREDEPVGEEPIEKNSRHDSTIRLELNIQDLSNLINTSMSFLQGSEQFNYTDLPPWVELDQVEEHGDFSCGPVALENYYCSGIASFKIPYAIDTDARVNMKAIGKEVFGQAVVIAQGAAAVTAGAAAVTAAKAVELHAQVKEKHETRQEGGLLDSVTSLFSCQTKCNGSPGDTDVHIQPA